VTARKLPARVFPTLAKPISILGAGCWAIGGPAFRGDEPLGYGASDDAESRRALNRALDLGVTLFDTAALYGCGHSERLLGEILPARRDEATIVSKFGYRVEESSRRVLGHLDLPRELPLALDQSLARLRVERIDLYLLHLRDFPCERIDDLIAALEHEVERGRIAGYGWSTDDLERARSLARGPRCAAIELAMNVLQGDRALLEFTRRRGLLALLRSPLAMGRLPASRRSILRDDIRSRFDDRDPRWRAIDERLDAIRAILGRDGRTIAQGALRALLARADHAIPIPGFKTVRQVEENVAAAFAVPLSAADLAELDALVAGLDLPPDPLALRS
jgi:aryl-alcohol dehydrogenase-like predicted oxidoreductase